HGAATAFGTTIQEMGIDSALSIGLAAATFGLVAGGLIGGPIVKHLISKYDLKPTETDETEDEDVVGTVQKSKSQVDSRSFMIQAFIITLCMAVGSYVGALFTNLTG